MWGKLAYGLLFGLVAVIVAPVVAAIFAFGCFMVTALYTGMVFGALDALGIVKWNDTTFLAVTIPLAVVTAIACVVFRDRITDY